MDAAGAGSFARDRDTFGLIALGSGECSFDSDESLFRFLLLIVDVYNTTCTAEVKSESCKIEDAKLLTDLQKTSSQHLC